MGAAVWANTGVLLKVFNLSDEILPQPGFVVLPVFGYFHQSHSSVREEQVRVPVAGVKNMEIAVTERANTNRCFNANTKLEVLSGLSP